MVSSKTLTGLCLRPLFIIISERSNMFIFKKFISDPKNKIVALILFLSIFFFFISYQTVGLKMSTKYGLVSSTKVNVKSGEKGISELSEYLKGDIKEDEKANDEKLLDRMKQQLAVDKEKLEAATKKDYKEFYRLEEKNALLFLKSIDEEGEKSPMTGANKDYFSSYITWYNQAKLTHQKFAEIIGANASGFGWLNYLLSALGGLFGLILITVLCGDALGNEFPNGLRFYHLLKKRRSKLQFDYLFVPIITALIIIVGGLIIPLIIAIIQFGIGDYKFPEFVVNATYTQYAGELLIWKVIYFVLALLFITSLGQLISQFIKKAYISSAIIVLVLVGYSILETQKVMQDFIKWIPLTYLNITKVIYLSNGDKNWPDTGNYLFGHNSFWIGALMLLGCTIIFYSTTYFIFSKYTYRKE